MHQKELIVESHSQSIKQQHFGLVTHPEHSQKGKSIQTKVTSLFSTFEEQKKSCQRRKYSSKVQITVTSHLWLKDYEIMEQWFKSRGRDPLGEPSKKIIKFKNNSKLHILLTVV